MAKQTVPLYTVSSGDRVERARERFAETLGKAEIGAPDEAGMFTVTVEADSPEAAEAAVREALAASGTGDDFALRSSIEGREMPPSDPRQPQDAEEEQPAPPSPDERAGHVADAASRVEQAARRPAAQEATESVTPEPPSAVADVAHKLAQTKPGPLEEAAEKLARETPGRVAAATQRLADETPSLPQPPRDWKRIAPPAAGILALLILLRRITR